MKHAFAIVLLTALVTIIGTAQAEACSCGAMAPPPPGFPLPPPPSESDLEKQVEQALSVAVAVFTGKAVKLDRLTVTFQVEKNWKGAATNSLSISNGSVAHSDGSIWSSSCDLFFSEGETYLVFAYGQSRGDMRADGVCNTLTTGRLAIRVDTVRRLDRIAARKERGH